MSKRFKRSAFSAHIPAERRGRYLYKRGAHGRRYAEVMPSRLQHHKTLWDILGDVS